MKQVDSQMSGELIPDRSFRSFFALSLLLAGVALAGCALVTYYRWQCRGLGIDTAYWGQLLHLHQAQGIWEYTGYVDQPGVASRVVWGTHFHLTLIPLGWLYQFIPHFLPLYGLQHLAFVLGGVLVGILGWQCSKRDALVGWCFLLAFLLYPPLVRPQVGFDYSPRHLAMLFLPLALLAFRHGWHVTTLASLVFLTAGMENLGLLAGFFCFVLAWENAGRRSWYLVAGLALTLYPFIVIRWGMPLFRPPDAAAHIVMRYQHLWSGDGLSTMVAAIFNPESGRYLLSLLGPLAFLPLVFPTRWLLVTVPFLLQNLLSLWPETRLIGHHYTSPLAVAFFLCVLPALEHPRRRFIAVTLLLFCLIVGNATNPVLSQISMVLSVDTQEMETLFAEIEQRIPAGVSLSAPHNLAARLYQRRYLWFFPQGAHEADFVIVPKMALTFPSVSAASCTALAEELLQGGKAQVVGENAFYQVLQRKGPLLPGAASPPAPGAP